MKTFKPERMRLFCVYTVALLAIACGAETGTQSGGDAGTQEVGATDASAEPDGISFGNADTAGGDVGAAEVQPTTSIEPTVAFGELMGTYTGQAKNVSGSSLSAFDEDAQYTFVIDANGTVTFNTKAGTDVYTWAAHGKRIVRNNANQVTVIDMEESNKRVLTITYRPGSGPFDIAGVTIDPAGRWYFTSIKKAVQ